MEMRLNLQVGKGMKSLFFQCKRAHKADSKNKKMKNCSWEIGSVKEVCINFSVREKKKYEM